MYSLMDIAPKISLAVPICIGAFILLAIVCTIICVSCCIISGRAAQWEETHLGIRRS